MACGLRRRGLDRAFRSGDGDRGHDVAISPGRPWPDALGGSNRRGGDRRRLRDRVADRRYRVLRHAVAVRGPDADAAAAFAPNADSVLWWPARAAVGEIGPLLRLLAGGLILLGAVMVALSPRFSEIAMRASATAARTYQGSRSTLFRAASRQQALRRKEFLLLRRDPWLVSQSLMQLLYLVPPAVMLWRSFADTTLALVLITPVIVMAAGQLAGGLAWLTISGEDAADLVATAPLTPSRMIRAKIEVVLIA